jgi:hypothetical protein
MCNCAAQVHQSDCPIRSDPTIGIRWIPQKPSNKIRITRADDILVSDCHRNPAITNTYHPQENNESTMLPSKTQTLPKAVQASTTTACHPPILLYATFSSLLKIANKNLFYKTHPSQSVISSTLSHSFFIHPLNRFSIKDFLMTLNS